MPHYSENSINRLRKAHHDLIAIFLEVVKGFDNTIIYAYRTPEEQMELYKKGRRIVKGIWIIDEPEKIVTNCDGYNVLSKHNYEPARAVDAIPYPIDWHDEDRMLTFGGYVMGVANKMFLNGTIGHRLRWGGDWNRNWNLKDQQLKDLVHFEIVS